MRWWSDFFIFYLVLPNYSTDLTTGIRALLDTIQIQNKHLDLESPKFHTTPTIPTAYTTTTFFPVVLLPYQIPRHWDPASLRHIFELNFWPLSKKIKAHLWNWNKTAFTWFGQNSILKLIFYFISRSFWGHCNRATWKIYGPTSFTISGGK